MVLNNDAESWRAVDTVTGEMCPHHHHTKTSAMRCGNSVFFPHKVKAIKWEVEDYKGARRIPKGIKRHIQRVANDETDTFDQFLEGRE